MLLWSSAFITTKPIIDNSDPFAALTFRFLIVAIGFCLFSIYSKIDLLVNRKNFIESFFSGVMFHGFYLGGVFFSISKGMPTAIAALIVTLQPILTNALSGPILKEKVSLIGFISIVLAMSGITVMIGDSISSGTLFGNIVALTIPISFSILVMIIRKHSSLDLVPAIWYASVFSFIYAIVMVESFNFTNHDIFMGFLLGVPQLGFGFICITIGSKTTRSVTVGLLMLTETIFAPIWVWLFLNEIPPLSVFIGGIIIILAIIVKSLDRNKSIAA